MQSSLEKSWKKRLKGILQQEFFKKLSKFVDHEYTVEKIYPPQKKIFDAFKLTPFAAVSVIILGQDPYHNPNQAHGLCFSVADNAKVPPSLKNIYKEIYSDLGICKNPAKGNLETWAQQGVLLLNSVLTVKENKPGSHAKKGWEEFTDAVITTISEKHNHCVFLLWGTYAGEKSSLIDQSKHLVLTSAHPSPLSAYRGFFGNKHFSQANTYLKKHRNQSIDW